MQTYDYVIIGSGFGGSVSAMRLTEKGYSVLVLERGKRYEDRDFPKTNWKFWKFLWIPALRCYGIFQISLMNGAMILHGNGIGGGSLGYSNVLEVPPDEMFESPAWKHLADWKSVLQPHYETARKMLGVTDNPRLGPADEVLIEIARERGTEATFRPTEVGIFFGNEGEEASDPYFGGEGPPRSGCTYCGACMIGCRENAKNTLVKNYLYFAEKWGADVRPEADVKDVKPLTTGQPDGARFEVTCKPTTAIFRKPEQVVRARNVILSAGVLGTLKLLFHCRDESRTLPDISKKLGEMVRTNSEALLGALGQDDEVNYSEGITITSIMKADEVTRVEPVRYPDGSSLIRFLSTPLISIGGSTLNRVLRVIYAILRHPIETLRIYLFPGWARRGTILLVMQVIDNRMCLHLGRSIYTLFRKGLVAEPDQERSIPTSIELSHEVTLAFARKTGSIPMGSIGEGILNIPTTAHILGGCLFGENDQDGVVDLDCQVHNYPGLYVVDGSIVHANPGVNPSLTITALAEYAMSRVPPKDGKPLREPLGVVTDQQEVSTSIPAD